MNNGYGGVIESNADGTYFEQLNTVDHIWPKFLINPLNLRSTSLCFVFQDESPLR